MAGLFVSLRLFVVRAWFIAVLAMGLAVNPVRLLQLMGWLKPGYVFPIPAWGFRAAFAGVLLVALFVWFHRQRIAFELVRPADPKVVLTDALRYVARRSRWAAKDSGDDNWIRRLDDEVLGALSLGRVTAFGRKYSPNADREFAISPIPAEFWRTASLFSFDIMNERTTQQTVHSTGTGGPAYTEIYFDRAQLRQAWPPRSALAALRRKSPAERRGNVADWRERDRKLNADERRIRDELLGRLQERDARSADRRGA
jgi:hypothetical protein